MRECVLATVVAVVASFTAFDGRPALADLICPGERAAYAMGTEDGDFSLSFIPAHSHASMASNLYACLGCPAGKLVRSGHVKRLCLLNGKFDFISEPPVHGDPVPSFIMMPELGATLGSMQPLRAKIPLPKETRCPVTYSG